MGLVNRVLPDGELETYVKDYADTIAGNAPLTVNSVKYIVGETVKDESEAQPAEMRRPGGAVLRQQRLQGRPHGLHGKAQAGVHRLVRIISLPEKRGGVERIRGGLAWRRLSCAG